MMQHIDVNKTDGSLAPEGNNNNQLIIYISKIAI